MNTRTTILLFISIPLIFVGIWFFVQAGDEILLALRVLFWGIVGGVVLAEVALLTGLIWRLVQRARLDAARATKAQREALLTVITAGPHDQVITYDGRNFVKRHQDPRIVSPDHKSTEPTQADMVAYAAWLASQSPRAAGAIAAPVASGWNIVPPLLEAIAGMERGLVVGGSGSGKTTVLQHIIARRPGDVLVIDPHDDRHTWPGNAQVVGGGQDYRAIESALVQITEQVQARYQRRYEEYGYTFTPLTLVFDEWVEVFGNTKEAKENMQLVLTGGRKVSFCLLVSSHSERVKPLGLDGAGDLKDGFYVMRIKGDQARGYSATLDTGEGEQAIALPGPYAPSLGGPVVNPQLPPPMDDKVRRVLELHRAGTSITAIGKAVYKGHKGGEQNRLVREIIHKYLRV